MLGQSHRSALASGRSIIVDAYRHWLALGGGPPAECQQRQQRGAEEHGYDVGFHCETIIA